MAKLRNFDWRQQADLLIASRNKQSWADEASSFSDWLRKKAEREGIQISTLWRYLNAATYAVANKIGPWQSVTRAELIPSGVSAEALELTEKISRVAPKAVMDVLLAEVYLKKLRRQELLKIWQDYRVALPCDASARGRGVKRPVVDTNRPEHQAVILKVKALNLLEQLAPASLGYPADAHIRVLKTTSVCSANLIVCGVQHQIIAIDPIVMSWDTLCHDPSTRDALDLQRTWLLTYTATNPQAYKMAASTLPGLRTDWPTSWGLIQMSDTALTVIKQPTSPAQPIPLAARLALQALL